MPLNRDLVGREYPAGSSYEVGREKVRDFALGIGETNPVCLDAEAARAAGHPDVLAPPTFLTVLGFRFGADDPVADPELGLDYSVVVHGEQRFVAHRPVHAGDVLHSVVVVEEIKDAGANELMTTRTDVTDAAGEPVATLHSTIVSRGTGAGRRA